MTIITGKVCKHCHCDLYLDGEDTLLLWRATDTPLADTSQYCWIDFVAGSQLHEPITE
jgi:hypothetical protein